MKDEAPGRPEPRECAERGLTALTTEAKNRRQLLDLRVDDPRLSVGLYSVSEARSVRWLAVLDAPERGSPGAGREPLVTSVRRRATRRRLRSSDSRRRSVCTPLETRACPGSESGPESSACRRC